RQVEITFANQLSQAYPDLDMRRILELVGTKWNIGTFQPSFGTGGYCIPLAPQYVLQGAGNPEALSLLEASIKSDSDQPYKVVESLVARGAKRVGILGLTYTADLQVHILSPTIRLAQGLMSAGVEVKVHDPYYSPEEIRQIAETDAFEFPGDLSEFDTVLINSGHLLYRSTPDDVVASSLAGCELLLDSPGIWTDITFSEGTRYYRTGGAGWLSS
ncbi:MAG: UDP binding domain-containing protein, partial [Myxococcota bacterium]|nr:UDP binding domain-containing protein [Myxococcota bacterium]